MKTTGAMAGKLPRTVVVLGLVSFFTDLSSEMIYPLLPVFLAGVLGAGPAILGLIEGVAETTASVLKLASGYWADRLKKRKGLVLLGYGISSIARPLVGLALSWPFVLVLRFTDRVGKGIRSSPRDALIADAAPPERRGEAYGFHRSMDHAGAVAGPLVAALLMGAFGMSMRHVFLWAALPGVVVIALILAGVRETPKTAATAKAAKAAKTESGETGGLFTPDFKRLLAALAIFTLGNSTDAFLLLRLSRAGVSVQGVAFMWSAFHVVKMASTYLGGRVSDRLGRKGMILSGWILYAAVYAAMGVIDNTVGVITIFLIYGLYYGLTEPCEKAWVADLVPPNARGRAFGLYNGVVGITALPASILFGLLSETLGMPAAFFTGAGLAVAASFLLAGVAAPKNGVCEIAA